MIAMDPKIKVWFDSLDRKKDLALSKSDDLYNAIRNLQYEGKVSQGQNIKVIEESIQFFKGELTEHIKIDEQGMFPFLVTHVPKLEPILRFLSAEHLEIRNRLKTLQGLLKHLHHAGSSESEQNKLCQLRDEGTYLVCLLRNHLQSETTGVYKVMERELNENEKKILLRKCSRVRQ